MIRVHAEAGKNIRSAVERSNTGERSGSCLMEQGLSLFYMILKMDFNPEKWIDNKKLGIDS